MTDAQLQGASYEDFMTTRSIKKIIQDKIKTLDTRCQLQEAMLMDAIKTQDSKLILERQAQFSETSGRFIELVDFVSMLQKEGVL